MAGFLGARVVLLLNQPPNAEVQGTVHSIVAGETLSLLDVYFPATNSHLPAFTVQSSAIADIKVIVTKQDVAPPKPKISPHPPHRVDTKLSTVEYPPELQSPATYNDPAILSYDRTRPHKNAVELAAAVPTGLRHDPPAQEENIKRKRQPKQKVKDPSEVQQLPILDTETSRHGNVMDNHVKRDKGWRQTPLLQPAEEPAKQSKRKQKHTKGESQNGWATEDATDIQDMGEFDFEANHKLFDKQQVFDDLRKGDTTADEDRLVSHNKLAPRKNLLPSENVLSPKLETEDKGSDADTDVAFNTGRSSSRQSLARRHQARSNSGLPDGRSHVSSTTPSSDRLLQRSATANSKANRPLPISTVSGSKVGRNFSPHSATTTASKRMNGTRSPTGLYIQGDVPCPTLYPSALDLLEEETCSRYALPPEVITENAGRAIAEQAIAFIDSPAEMRRGSRPNTTKPGMTSSAHGFENVPPVIVVLAGTHTTGSRALAAARQLSSRGFKLIIVETPSQASNEQCGKQMSMIKKMIRAGANIKRGAWPKANEYIRGLNGPPVVIIDALLSGAKYEDVQESTHDDTLATDIRRMIDWANRSRAPVLSVKCPSGLSDHDGSATIVDGEPLAIKADRLVALGAPVTGVLEALKLGEGFDILLADIGINIALKADDAVSFGTQWTVPLTFVATEQDAD